jgi:hypothetical protein
VNHSVERMRLQFPPFVPGTGWEYGGRDSVHITSKESLYFSPKLETQEYEHPIWLGEASVDAFGEVQG